MCVDDVMANGSKKDKEHSLKKQPSFKWAQFKGSRSPTKATIEHDSPQSSPQALEHTLPVCIISHTHFHKHSYCFSLHRNTRIHKTRTTEAKMLLPRLHQYLSAVPSPPQILSRRHLVAPTAFPMPPTSGALKLAWTIPPGKYCLQH